MVGYAQLKKLLFIAIASVIQGGFTSAFALANEADSLKTSAEIITSYYQTLDPKAPNSAVTFFPSLAVSIPPMTTLGISALIERPTDKYKNFEIPRTVVTLRRNLVAERLTHFGIDASVSGVEMQRWNAEGAIVRNCLGPALETKFENGFEILLAAKGFYQINQYRQNTDGTTKSQYGFSEKLAVGYETGRTSFGVTLVVTQRYTNLWKNDYGTEEQIAYQLDNTWSVGLGHALLGATVDETTGRVSDFKAFDNRKSQVSAFVGVKL